MKTDIATYNDVEFLVREFYTKVRADESIGYFFNEVVSLNWEKHIPHIAQFWAGVLLSLPGFQGNPVYKHLEIHRLAPLEPQHFERWFELWSQTLDELFEGSVAESAKLRARSISSIMLTRIAQMEQPVALDIVGSK